MADALTALIEWGNAQDVDWGISRFGRSYQASWRELGNLLATTGSTPYEAAARLVAHLEAATALDEERSSE